MLHEIHPPSVLSFQNENLRTANQSQGGDANIQRCACSPTPPGAQELGSRVSKALSGLRSTIGHGEWLRLFPCASFRTRRPNECRPNRGAK